MTSFVAVFGGVGVAVADAASSSYQPTAADQMLVGDLLRGILVTLVFSFVTVASAVAINQAAAVLDRRDLYANLARMGMPLRQLDASRRLAVRRPLAIVSLGSAMCAGLLILPLAGMALMSRPLTLLVIAGALIAGLLLVSVSMRLTSRVVRRVVAEPAPAL